MRSSRPIVLFCLTTAFAGFALGCGGRLVSSSDGCAGGDCSADSGGPDGLAGDAADGDGAAGCGFGACTPGTACTPADPCRICLCLPSGGWDCPPVTCPAEAGVVCPASLPTNGTACTSPQTCPYSGPCGTSTATCSGGLWSVAAALCSDPNCPSVPPLPDTSWPLPGIPCSAPMQCVWPNSCGDHDLFTCIAGTWNRDRWCAPCPASAPPDGSACIALDTACSWDNGCNGKDDAYCNSNGTWHVERSGCFPPCPVLLPGMNMPCPAYGQRCEWTAQPCGASEVAVCEPNGWQTDYRNCY
jgi:hypothetical protein